MLKRSLSDARPFHSPQVDRISRPRRTSTRPSRRSRVYTMGSKSSRRTCSTVPGGTDRFVSPPTVDRPRARPLNLVKSNHRRRRRPNRPRRRSRVHLCVSSRVCARPPPPSSETRAHLPHRVHVASPRAHRARVHRSFLRARVAPLARLAHRTVLRVRDRVRVPRIVRRRVLVVPTTFHETTTTTIVRPPTSHRHLLARTPTRTPAARHRHRHRRRRRRRRVPVASRRRVRRCETPAPLAALSAASLASSLVRVSTRVVRCASTSPLFLLRLVVVHRRRETASRRPAIGAAGDDRDDDARRAIARERRMTTR